jgi:hypothetical protein
LFRLDWHIVFKSLRSGFKDQLELDFLLVVRLITRPIINIDANYTLVMKARELITKDRMVQIQHIFREANAAADWLANYNLIRNPINRNNWIIQIHHQVVFYLVLWYYCIHFSSFNIVFFSLVFKPWFSTKKKNLFKL